MKNPTEIVGFEAKEGDQLICLKCWGPLDPEDKALKNYTLVTVGQMRKFKHVIYTCEFCGELL